MTPRREGLAPYIGSGFQVAQRELRGLLRSPWSFVLAAVLVGLLGLGAGYGLPRGAATSTAVAQYAQRGYAFYQIYLYLVALIVAPGLAALSVAAERRQNTLEQLQLTWLSPGQIVLGKTAAVLFLFLLLCAATLPIAGMVYFFAGVDLSTMARLPLHLGPFALCCAATGMAQGMLRKDAFSAWSKAVTKMLTLCFWPYILGGFMIRFLLGPDLALAAIAAYFIFFAGVSLLLARRAIRGVACYDSDFIRDPGPFLRAGQFRPMAPMMSRTARAIKDGANPAYVKERWTGSLCGGVYWGHLLLLGLPFGMLSGSGLSRAVYMTHEGGRMGLPQMLILLALIPAFAVMLINQERELGTLEQLRASPLAARAVLWGKIGALLRAMLPFLLGVFLGDLFVAWATSSADRYVNAALPAGGVAVQCFVRLPAFLGFIACCAMTGALLARNSLNALVLGYGAATLGTVLYAALRAITVGPATEGLGNGWGDAAVLAVCSLDAALLVALGAGAFGWGCYAYRRAPGE